MYTPETPFPLSYHIYQLAVDHFYERLSEIQLQNTEVSPYVPIQMLHRLVWLTTKVQLIAPPQSVRSHRLAANSCPCVASASPRHWAFYAKLGKTQSRHAP